jgi:hypothetical protein
VEAQAGVDHLPGLGGAEDQDDEDQQDDDLKEAEAEHGVLPSGTMDDEATVTDAHSDEIVHLIRRKPSTRSEAN